MKLSMRPASIAAFMFMLFCFSACRSTTVTPPAIPETPLEGPEASPQKIDLPAEPTKAPEMGADTSAQAPQRRLPESVLSMPEKHTVSRRLVYDTMVGSRPGPSPLIAGWHYRRTRQGQIVGFEFSNHGGNRILPPRRDPLKNRLFARDFQFRFDERARQDIHLYVADWAPSRDGEFRLSELMNSVFYFFPRHYLPAIVNFKDRNVVTLPTGEEVEFNARSGEIVAGALSEMSVDLESRPAKRQFPGVAYRGKGVLVRADARGSDPRIGTIAVITTGTPLKDCPKGAACGRCQLPSQELWEQSGAVRFRFASDDEFNRFLLARCGFGIPRFEVEYTASRP